MPFIHFPKKNQEKPPVDPEKRKRQIAMVVSLNYAVFFLMLYTWLMGQLFLGNILWALGMALIPLEYILRGQDVQYMKLMMGTAIVLMVLSLARPAIPEGYTEYVRMADLFLSVMVLITFYHKFFDGLTEKLVQFAKKIFGAG